MIALNIYEKAIVKNADWFMSKEIRPGYVDADGDEFYGVRGDATLIGHAVTVRMLAYKLTGEERYRESAERSLRWLADRQDSRGGWKKNTAFTLDAAQCVFEGFNTYQQMTGNTQFQATLIRAADRMVRGTIGDLGELLLPNVIEIGEYAHFSLLAWKTTGEERFKKDADIIVGHILRNFDAEAGCWLPYDKAWIRRGALMNLIRPVLRLGARYVPLRGRLAARLADTVSVFVVGMSHPQYSMSMMDAEAVLDTDDGSCAYPELKEQTRRAVRWVATHCAGPFPGSLVESIPVPFSQWVYPLPIINDTCMAALWPTACLLLAYVGMRDSSFASAAKVSADWIVSVQDEVGGFYNFQKPDGKFYPLQSGNVNFYASLALWHYSNFLKQKTSNLPV